MINSKWEFRKTKTAKVITLAVFIAASSVIQIIENTFIPSQIPLRPGFANALTLMIIDLFGPGEAILVAVARSILASLLSGKILSVPFLLSLSGGIISAAVMGYLYNRFENLGIIGVSITGAIIHNFTQLIVIYMLIIHNQGIFKLIPWLWLIALFTGTATGYIARATLRIPIFQSRSNSREEKTVSNNT